MGVAVSVCAQCGTELAGQDRFCRSCGAPAAAACSSCGLLLEPGDRFCRHCGTPTALAATASPPVGTPAPVAERRVTSVLFADLVGFTPLSESRDAEEVRELLSAYFEQCRTVIGRYGGVVEKFIGDAVMAVWGVPVAHEDDAERAVRAGLELVGAVRLLGETVGVAGLAMRVGVVTGEVAVTVGATTEGMVAGDAVNTAARVQTAAQPGTVAVDETTRSLTAAAITFEDAGSHALKGKAEPLQLWRATAVVAAVGGRERIDGLEAPLTGRDRELRALKDLFHACEESGRPRMVVVDGEPGVGKSRLAWEFEKYVDGLRRPVAWHRGRCLSYGDGVAFWALAEAVRSRLGLTEADTGDTVRERLEAGLAALAPDAAERDWLRPRVATLIGAGGGIAGMARDDLFAAWATFLERAGGGDPVVFVVDDAQYADDGLLDFLEHLLATAQAAVYVLALARPELLARRHDVGGRRTSVIRLEPLDASAMAALVDGLVLGLPDGVRAELVARSEGIPLFAVETVRALIDRDAVLPSDGRYVAGPDIDTALADVGAPASLHALVAARLDALSGPERAVVAAAAVLGQSFTRDGLVALAGADVDLDDALASLRRKEILTLQTDRFSAEQGQYRFVQGIVRQVAYSTQSRHDRRVRHLAAAAYLGEQADPGGDLAVVIAQHLLDAVDSSAPTATDLPLLTARARTLLEQASQRAGALGSPAEALRLAEAALARTDDVADRARLQLRAAQSAYRAGRHDDAARHAEAALAAYDSLADPASAGLAAAVQANVVHSRGESGLAIEIAEPRWRAVEGVAAASEAQLALLTVLARAHDVRGETEAAGHYQERKLRVAESIGDPEQVSAALAGLGITYMTAGAPVAARLLLEGAATLARTHDLPESLARALNNLTCLTWSRDLPAALACAREGMEAARRSGGRDWIDFTALNYVLALWAAGQLDEAARATAQAQEGALSLQLRTVLSTVETWLADALGHPLPPSAVDEATDSETTLTYRETQAMTRKLVDGDTSGAAALARQTLPRVLAVNGLEDDFLLLWPPVVLAALADGNYDLAEEFLHPVTTASPGTVAPALHAYARRFQGLIGAARGEDPVGVEADLRAGVAGLATLGAVGAAAQARQELGLWLLAQGRPGDGAPEVDRAREAFAAIGAAGWLARLDAAVLAVDVPHS